MHKLIIRHVAEGVGNQFVVQRETPHKSATAVAVADPLAIRLDDTDLKLGTELQWYLEDYLDYPYGPCVQRAERVMSALRAWGKQSFLALFGHDMAHLWYHEAIKKGSKELHLVIASDDAHVLAWPWEALHDPLVGDLAHHCNIERQLDQVNAPLPLQRGLSKKRIGILLVTARPYEDDIDYRSISRPLVELIHRNGLPAEVKVLRPPTLAQLQAELTAHPGAYHIVHFDGHGGFGAVAAFNAFAFKGPQGQLIFEKDDGSADAVNASQISGLLREHSIPIAVLNACQSAMLGGGSEDAFASVATALLRAGVRSVVAMGYSLYVTAAKQFLPAFYYSLFQTGSVADATRAGRRAMLKNPERMDGFILEDWLVPVLYQQEPLRLDFVKKAQTAPALDLSGIPHSARLRPNEAPYGLMGRDSAVQALERACRRQPAGVLVHGLGGIGKTTLVRGYIEWLVQTQGLPATVLWLSFEDIRSADYVLSRLVEALFGTDAMAAPTEQMWPAVLQALRTKSVLIVWDSFESASCAAEDSLGALMPQDDLLQLKQWLELLRGGKTKVLITSRSPEEWLDTSVCYRLPLGGLNVEERQALAQAILDDQGIKFDSKDQACADLIASLKGHPQMMQAILPRLGRQSAASLLKAIAEFEPQSSSTNRAEQKLYANLRFVEQGLPQRLKPLLYPISLHEGHVHADFLADMAEVAQQPFTHQDVRQTLSGLEAAGLMQGIDINVFSMHPALTAYLLVGAKKFVGDISVADAWQRSFVVLMAEQVVMLDLLAPHRLHGQHAYFMVMEGNIVRARQMAEADGGFENYALLTAALIANAGHRHNLRIGYQYFAELVHHCKRHGREEVVVNSYLHLGLVAEEREDFVAAEGWYRKSLEYNEGAGNEFDAEVTYHGLGRVAQQQADFVAADSWYRKSLEINERLGNERQAVAIYRQLGSLAQQQRDFVTAEEWYRKSLEIDELPGNEGDAAPTYHQLGTLAHQQEDFAAAEEWYRKSLEIKEQPGNEQLAAITYFQLGKLAQQQENFVAADSWYHKSLKFKEQPGNKQLTAAIYNQLGRLALQQRDFESAKSWFLKSLRINERLGLEREALGTYRLLGLIAVEQGDFVVAEEWFSKFAGEN